MGKSEVKAIPPQSPGGPRETRGTSRIALLRAVLAVAISLFAVAPIFLHHAVGSHPARPHQLSHVRTSSRHVGRKSSTIETVQVGLGNSEVFNFAFEDEHTSDIAYPPDIGGAGRSLLLKALEKRPVFDDALQPDWEEERCRKYFTYANYQSNFSDYKGRKRRRVFLGSLIADDSWHALGAIAMETYGVYTAVAFVESNRTQIGIPRKLRFVNGTVEHKILVESNLFGPDTPVLLDYFSFEGEIDGGGLIREHMQRSLVIDMWKRAGMTADDVGVLTDADETLTRDFLRAVQACDIPQLDPARQDCGAAKVIASSMVFEGSPECMTVTRKWMHPDVILGKCIEGIGDDAFKLDDKQRQRKFAWRKKQFTHKYGNYSGWPEEKKTYPLWNAADFRRDQGGHTGFHFHNYFETTRNLRKKYATYGHPVKGAENMTVGEMHPDLDLMVDCVLGRTTAGNRHNTLSTRLEEFEGRVPLAYGLEGYTMARHLELKAILMDDEKGHDKSWHDNPKSVDWYERIPK